MPADIRLHFAVNRDGVALNVTAPAPRLDITVVDRATAQLEALAAQLARIADALGIDEEGSA